MRKVKWGILSTANIGQTQLIPAIERADNAEVVAIASRGPKVHDVAAKLNIAKAYESYEELLQDSEVEAIYIPLPNDLHKEWSIKCARAGKHVLCEKPVVLAAQDLEEIYEVFEEENKCFMEAFMYQFHPQHARVKEIIASDEIGDVKLFKSSHSFFFENRAGDIRMDASMGGGALWDVGCYSLHALQHIIEDVEVEKMEFHGHWDEETDVDVSAFGIVQLKNGIVGMVDCSFDTYNRNEYEVVGTKGTIKVKHAFRPDTFGGDGKVTITTGTSERIEYIQGDIYKLEVEFFSNSVINHTSLQYHHDASRKTTKLLLDAYASMRG